MSPPTTETRLNNISKSLTVTTHTLELLTETLKFSGLEAISNTTQSLAKLILTIKQNKEDCAELMEHTSQLLAAVVDVYLKSDNGGEDLAPSVLNQIGNLTTTLHKIHAFIEAQQTGNKFKIFFRQGELGALLKSCKADLQRLIAKEKIQITTVNILADMQARAEAKHQEVLNLIETLSSSDSASSISKMYSGSFASSTSISMLPASTQIFHGRESELADILKLFNKGNPRIAILGAGGMGKTSLAKAVLHEETIAGRYTQYRFFIPCDKAGSTAELASLIGAHLGLKSGRDMTRAVLQHLSQSPPSLLVLDNLETVWEPVEPRKDIEEFLSLLTDITTLSLMVTMRGAERPFKVQWTRPFLLPLRPLAQEAARKVFWDIADDGHMPDDINQVLQLTDNVPLAICLLAHLVDVEGCSTVLSRWQTEKTSVISDGHDKRSNMELSISLSLSSPRITSIPDARDLLSLMAILPDGLSDAELRQAKFPLRNILGCKDALVCTALAYIDEHKRLKVLVPIREYMQKVLPPADWMIKPLLCHFQELLEAHTTHRGQMSGAVLVTQVKTNFTNIQNIFRQDLYSEHSELRNTVSEICELNRFSRFQGQGKISLMEELSGFGPKFDHNTHVTFIMETLWSWEYAPISNSNALIVQGIEHLHHCDDLLLKAMTSNQPLSTMEWLSSWQKQRKIPQPKLRHFRDWQRQIFAPAPPDHYPIRQSEYLQIEYFGSLVTPPKYLVVIVQYPACQAYAQKAQQTARIHGNLYTEARALSYDILCLMALGNYTQCLTLAGRARSLLPLCGMASTELAYTLMQILGEVHKLKSEYEEAHKIHSHILPEALAHNPGQRGIALLNLAEVEVSMGVARSEIQQKLRAIQVITDTTGGTRLRTACETIQAELDLREENMAALLLFCKCLKLGWGNDSQVVAFCLERLADTARWEGFHHDSSWSTIFLVHSLKQKERLGTHKALQFIGDIFFEDGDVGTATSLFSLALDGFTQMDVHRSRAECLVRLGDISKQNANPSKALELWQMAKPLFERSCQTKRVADIEKRVAEMELSDKMKLVKLAQLTAPAGKVEGKKLGLPETVDMALKVKESMVTG
ncbi:hypothetical protein C8R46DRAFT_1322361 [Mycena filopes]|nr:hypothetical protein C8R46DRAFT_1322361 [Mycena filopes]